MNFADRFAGNMAAAYDELAANSPTAEATDAALQRKIGNVSAAYVNATASNPIVGLIDMIVTVTLLRQASEEPWFTELHGADAAKVAVVLKAQEADVWDIGSRLSDREPARRVARRDRSLAQQKSRSAVRLDDSTGRFSRGEVSPSSGCEGAYQRLRPALTGPARWARPGHARGRAHPRERRADVLLRAADADHSLLAIRSALAAHARITRGAEGRRRRNPLYGFC